VATYNATGTIAERTVPNAKARPAKEKEPRIAAEVQNEWLGPGGAKINAAGTPAHQMPMPSMILLKSSRRA
jgi:hypothetical protein